MLLSKSLSSHRSLDGADCSTTAEIDLECCSYGNLDSVMEQVWPVLSLTDPRLVNTLTSTSLTSRSSVDSVLGRHNQKFDVVENECG